jgi:hypothetical protein
MTEIVFAHEGTVAKIIGDAIHVLFGAPAEQPDAASRAIACALALDARSEAYRSEWKVRGVSLGATRIGVHAGPAIVGNFGGGRLFDYTAYGATINAASRFVLIELALAWGGAEPHPTPGRHMLLCLRGSLFFTSSDGATLSISAGEALLMTDTQGKGHATTVTADELVKAANDLSCPENVGEGADESPAASAT